MTATTKPQTKPQLSFWHIWNMCFGFIGIQFGFALQNANVSRIFQTLGAEIDQLPILWVAAPLTGLIVQPIVGYLSDNTWNRMGRRRPYFFWGAILASISLIIMPNSPTLWVAAGMLWVMDAAINISMEPFRAYVGDMLPEEQRPTGYAVQSFFIAVASVVASALPWVFANYFDISNTAAAGVIPDSVKYSFYCGGAVLFLAVMWTVVSTKEYSPEQLAAFDRAKQQLAKQQPPVIVSSRSASDYAKAALLWSGVGIVFTALIWTWQLEKELYILSVGLLSFGLLQLVMWYLLKQQRSDNGFATIMSDLYAMPQPMKQLAWVQFFAWFGLFSMWLYTTAAVAQVHFAATDVSSKAYNEGADWVGVMFAAYNGFAALAAIVIPWLIRLSNIKLTHLFNLTLGGIGLISIMLIQQPQWLLLSMVGIGFAWASILSLPYAMLANCLPVNKMGTYMGIFNFFIVIPQILAASILGLCLKHLFDNQPIYALVLGGVSMILAGILTLFVQEPNTESTSNLAAE